jgi:hypothetical protein
MLAPTIALMDVLTWIDYRISRLEAIVVAPHHRVPKQRLVTLPAVLGDRGIGKPLIFFGNLGKAGIS